MTPERYQQVKTIFLRACEMTSPRRQALIDDAVGGDAELRACVLDLLQHFDDPHSYVEARLSGGDVQLLAAALGHYPSRSFPVQRDGHAAVPARIGRYHIDRLIGEGGMSVVYAGRQEKPNRAVAVKLLRPGLMSPAAVRRFEHESEFLGRLQHPGIAHIYEAGFAALSGPDDTQAEVPFFAMELIDGRPLTTHAREARLDRRARLELFIQVCEAVQHAHHKGVIHRDIKPSNVLVDSDGRARVLDFGVAKAVRQDAANVELATRHTEAGQLIGTLAYMSPEQVAGDTDGIDTRTDVYALGLMLFELLTDRPAIDLRGVALPEAIRRIREQAPPPPSAAVPALRGDLDTIVAKALAKQPARRYASAAELASDLQHFLAGKPITARRDSAWYVLGKTLRRHRTLAVAGCLVLLTIAGAAVTATVLWRRAERQRIQAEHIAGFMEDTLKGVGPAVALGRDTTLLKDVMDQAAGRITSGELRAAPEAELRLRRTLGRIYQQLAELEAARDMLLPAVDLARRLHGSRALEVAPLLNELAIVYKANRELDAAEPLYREALALRQAHLEADDPLVATSLNNLGEFLRTKGDYDQAEEIHRTTLALRRRRLGNEHADVAVSLVNLALVQEARGDFAAAEPLYREALAIDRAVYGEVHPEVALDTSNLAVLLERLARFDEAETLTRQALAMRRTLYRADHPMVTESLNNLGTLLRSRGALEEAESLMREALDLDRQRLGHTHPRLATPLHNLAVLRLERGDLVEADALAREALALARAAYDEGHPAVTHELELLANVAMRSGRLDEAESLMREALARTRALHGDDHLEVGIILNNLSTLLKDRGAYADAEPLAREAIRIFREVHGDDHPSLGAGLNSLASILSNLEELEDAAAAQREANRIFESKLGPTHAHALTGRANLAKILMRQGEYAAAEDLYREVLATRRELSGDEHPQVAIILHSLGELFRDQSQCRAAVPWYEQTLEILENNTAAAPKNLGVTRVHLGMCLRDLGRFEDAEAALLRGADELEAALGAADRRTREAFTELVALYDGWNKPAEAQAWRQRLEADHQAAPAAGRSSDAPGGS